MITNANSIVPRSFPGDWDVVVQAGLERLSRVEIRHVQGDEYSIAWYDKGNGSTKSPSRMLRYDPESKTLRDEKGLCVAFWRQAAQDMVFAYDRKGSQLWSAKRSPQEAKAPVSLLGRPWLVYLSSGTRGAHEGSRVVLRSLKGDGASGGGAETGLFGLFYQKKGLQGSFSAEELYDVLAYNAEVASFNSIFNVRSFNYWPGDPDDPSDDRIFATFYSRFALPTLGRHRTLGSLLPFEVAAARPGADGDPPDDPDTGVWVGGPSSGCSS